LGNTQINKYKDIKRSIKIDNYTQCKFYKYGAKFKPFNVGLKVLTNICNLNLFTAYATKLEWPIYLSILTLLQYEYKGIFLTTAHSQQPTEKFHDNYNMLKQQRHRLARD